VLYRVWSYDKTLAREGAEICLPVETNDLNVKKATQWDATVGKYLPSKDPKDALFADLQAVVAGYLSIATTAQNERDEANKQLALARTEIENQKDKVANIQADCQKTYNLLLADYNTLKATAVTVEKLRGQYEGTITTLQGELREAQKATGQAELIITEQKAKIEALEKATIKSYKVGELLQMIWVKVRNLDIKL